MNTIELVQFKDSVLKHFHNNSRTLAAQEIDGFIQLLEQIVSMDNSATSRKGKVKAEFISRWLNQNGCKSKVLKLENSENYAVANEDNSWYVVEAYVGAEDFVDNGKNAIFSVHHDHVARNDSQIKLEGGKMSAQGIVDDSINLVSALYEFVNFNRWYEENKDSLDQNICVKLIVSDGEEVNTQGMKYLMNQWYETGKLKELAYMIVCEATSKAQQFDEVGNAVINENIVPGIAYANRGKVTGTFRFGSGEASCSDIAQSVFSFLRVWQEYFHVNSMSSETSTDREQLIATELIPTYFNLDGHEGDFIWELRTNKKIGACEGFKLMEKAVLDSNHIDRVQKVDNSALQCKFAEMYKYEITSEGAIVEIDLKDSIHPANFVLGKTCDPLTLSMLFLAGMFDEDRMKLTSVQWGDVNKPNSVPQFAKLYFSSNINFEAVLNRMLKADYLELVEKYIERGIELVKSSKVKMSIERNQAASCREGLEVQEKDWGLVEAAQNNLKKNINEAFGIECTPRINVFNAMHDGGPSTYEHIHPIVWANGEKLITIGVGDFNKLHGHETLSPAELAAAMVQYKDLLRSLTFPIK
ncbi:MAG: hypothetical protein QY318_04065 [Candidatus Dojkabacteria bacterium]|nr:MAG: hypothetical protein QY318_04065 [Candidatus Dojkabacteria bacterium]